MDDLLNGIDAIVGRRGWTTDEAILAAHAHERWGTGRGRAALLLRPETTEEVAKLLAFCQTKGLAVVPQGGNTGLTAGGIPDDSGQLAVLSLGRMNQIRALDPQNDAITVEAGCVLATVQAAAAQIDRLFPLALGAQGSCQIGGNLSTNAGGVNVLRYGMARNLVLGLEVVLADGRIWNGLRGLRKDNTGYDLKQLFIGAEGTLGVITAAVLRLLPRPREVQTAWAAVDTPEAALDLFGFCRERLGETISSFELMSGDLVDSVLAYLPEGRSPIDQPSPWHVLIEAGWSLPDGLRERVEQVLAAAMERGLLTMATMAASEAQRQALWVIRESPTDAMANAGLVLRHDVSVPISSVPALIAKAQVSIKDAVPGARFMPFGHLGDGNVHVNILQPQGGDPDQFRAQKERVQTLIFDLVESLGGSISAEHGIGRLKRAELALRKDPVELELMRSLKSVLDPKGVLNPGVIL